MNKIDLSIVVPGIRTEIWNSILEGVKKSSSRHTFEIIFCSPHDLPEALKNNPQIIHIKDFGSPSRCLQHAASNANGKYLAIMSDDVIIHENSFSDAVDQLSESFEVEKNILALRYTEGINFNANPSDFSESYWQAHYHGDLRLVGIDPSWRICLMFMIKTSRFLELGGLDCRFEHFNMNLHDLAFRNQMDGGKILISKNFITSHSWEPNRTVQDSYILAAYHQNDYPLFHSIYGTQESRNLRNIKINFDNWKDQPSHWPRKYR